MAIGARRVAELARSLRDCGARVSILAARADREAGIDHGLGARLTGIETVTAWKGISVLDPVYNWAKRLWRGPADSAAVAPAAVKTPSASARPSTLRRLADTYLALHAMLDRRKQWTFWAFFRSVGLRLRSGRFDIVIASSPPAAGFVVGYLHCRLFGSAFFMDMRDPWLLEAELASRRARLETPLERRCVTAAEKVICTSPGTARDLAARVPEQVSKIEVVYNGYDRAVASPPRSGRHTLTMLYAGALYGGRDPFPLLRALHGLVSRPDVERSRVRVQFAGLCDSFDNRSLREWVNDKGIGDVVDFLGVLPSEALSEAVANADVLINLSQRQQVAIPAKTFEHLGSSKEILMIAEHDSDSAAVLREAKRGIIVGPTDDSALQKAVETLYRRYVVDELPPEIDVTASEVFSRERQNDRYIRILSGARADRNDARAAPGERVTSK